MPVNYLKCNWIGLKRSLQEKIYGGRSPLYGEKPVPHVIAAAWINPKGDIYASDSHLDAAELAAKHNCKDAKVALKGLENDIEDVYKYLINAGWKDGFLTSEMHVANPVDKPKLRDWIKSLKAKLDKPVEDDDKLGAGSKTAMRKSDQAGFNSVASFNANRSIDESS